MAQLAHRPATELRHLVQRTVFFSVDAGETTFSVERWWLPVDHPVESLQRVALIWEQAGDAQVILLAPKSMEAVIEAMREAMAGA